MSLTYPRCRVCSHIRQEWVIGSILSAIARLTVYYNYTPRVSAGQSLRAFVVRVAWRIGHARGAPIRDT